MGRLIYLSNITLDGYITDRDGNFDWTTPSAEVHAAINNLVWPIGTHLYGRRLYDVMAVWETMDGESPEMQDFARIWRSTDKIVYSRTLQQPSSTRTRIETEFDPETVRSFVAEADRDVLIGGAELAGLALAAGLVDDLHLFVSPIILGGGTRSLPDDVRLQLELVDEERFENGTVHLHHRVAGR